MKDKKPFVSVAVCTYNGANKIEDCLKSLLNQNYPKDKYEIIVIDDGSTDKTFEIVSKYPVRLIKHKENKGLATARNTGLEYTKGKIYVCFDDDCIADKDWLKNLLEIYCKNKSNLAGVGGHIVTYNNKTLTDKLLLELNYGNPAPIEYGKSKNPIDRFLVYVKDMIHPISDSQEEVFEVIEIRGANSSFYKKLLIQLDGWNESLSGVEDTDLCSRIKKITDKKLLFTKKAKIIHNHNLKFLCFIRNIYKRSDKTLIFYRKNSKFPPIFPFPILTGLATIVGSYFNIFYGILALIFLPQILYFWWPIKFFKNKDFDFLLFPYMQILIEFSTILGMLRGYLILKLIKNDTQK